METLGILNELFHHAENHLDQSRSPSAVDYHDGCLQKTYQKFYRDVRRQVFGDEEECNSDGVDSVGSIISSIGITVDGIRRTHSVSTELFARFVWPLAVYLFARSRSFSQTSASAPSLHRRFVVGVSGAGGSGKSVTCALIAEVVNALHLTVTADQRHRTQSEEEGEDEDAAYCTVVGMDGYHFPNSYLLSHDTAHTPLNDAAAAAAAAATRPTLKSIKGRPETFDSAALAVDLHRISHCAYVRAEVADWLAQYERRMAHNNQPAKPLMQSYHGGCPTIPLCVPWTAARERCVLAQSIVMILHGSQQVAKCCFQRTTALCTILFLRAAESHCTTGWCWWRASISGSTMVAQAQMRPRRTLVAQRQLPPNGKRCAPTLT